MHIALAVKDANASANQVIAGRGDALSDVGIADQRFSDVSAVFDTFGTCMDCTAQR